MIVSGLGRLGVNELVKDDAKASDNTIQFAEIEVNLDDQILSPKDAIRQLEIMLDVEEGNIYKTVLKSGDIDKLVSIISGNSYDDFVEFVNKKAGQSLEQGNSYADWYKSLDQDSDLIKSFIKPGYWETVWNTNYSSLYNLGIQQESERLKEYIAFQEFIGVNDNQQTDICRSLDGKIRTAKEWQSSGLVPPLHYNERSILATISKFRADLEGIAKTPNKYFDMLKEQGIEPEKGFDEPLSIKNIIKNIK